MRPKKKRYAVVDGDLLLYTVSFRHQDVYEWENCTSINTNLDQAIKDINRFYRDLHGKIGPVERSITALSHSRCFRYSLLPSYKHNRKSAEKPVLYPEIKQYLKDAYYAKEVEGLEADDQLGIAGTFSKTAEYVICSFDKDLEQIPGLHFNWKTDTSVREVSLEEGNRKFYTQVLTGDTTDGFSGCPGIGPKKAEGILNGLTDEAEIWAAIVKTYENAGLNEEYALTMARMARILRHEDWDEVNQKPILWTPKKG